MSAQLDQTWKHLIAHSQGPYDPVYNPVLIPPLLLRAAIPDDFCPPSELGEVFCGLRKDRDVLDTALLRVYVNGMASPEHEDRFLREALELDEDIEEWLRRALRVPRFGVIVNGAERWMDMLARKVTRLFAPLYDHWGIPTTSTEITLFIGNYGYTPFGIHVDDPYTNVFHFHLGPGSKRMTLITPELFHKLNGRSRRSFEIDRIVPEGETFEIRAGDVFLLPPHYYHVGAADEFSIGVAVAVGRYPPSALQAKAVKQAVTLPGFSQLTKAALGGGAPPRAAHLSLSEWIEQAYDEFVAAERSRRGLRYSATRRPTSVRMSSRVQIDPDYPMELLARDDRLICYVRGHRIELAYCREVVELLTALSESVREIEVASLCKRFEDAIEAEAVLHLLGELEACGGLVVLSHAAAPVQA